MKTNKEMNVKTKVPLFLITASLFIVTTSVNLQVPLYTTYAIDAHFGKALTALVFAAYILGLIPVLIFFGGISDQLGRKPILLSSLIFSFIATFIITIYPTMYVLLLTRIIQGISLGLSVGTCTAYLIGIYPEKSKSIPIYIALASSIGFGSGALFTTVVLAYVPSPTPISYWVILSCIILIFCAVLLFVPAVPGKGGKIMNLPTFPVGTLPIDLSIALAWTVSGLVISILPSQLKQYGLELWVGPALFLVNGVGALMQPFARRMQSIKALQLGFFLLPIGYVIMMLGSGTGLIFFVLIGAGIAGAACYGFTYLGGLSEVVSCSENEEARAVSGYFLFAYLGFGLPSILIGYIADNVGVFNSILYFSIVITLCSIILFFLVSKRKKHLISHVSKSNSHM
ncbi:MFS transporter [Priestia megaterium]|uniref:MFS transporter n=1 Tax=Priestia megaterium TaxID=1404 RepID=UPI0035D9CB19